jgi:ADP-ribose pyrophosphatase YjhB (NUDIX family)
MNNGKSIAAGIIPIHAPSRSIMMIRRGMDQSYPNTWSFFGGGFEEEDVTPKETAKREFKEESGIESIKYYVSTKPIYVNDNNHVRFYNFLGLFAAQDYGWFTLDSLPHNMHPGAVELFENKKDLLEGMIEYYS